MKIKVDLAKIKEKLKAQDDKQSFRDPKKSEFVVPLEAGKLQFRAFIYPHSSDPSAEPFLERFYHWGLTGTPAVYCPKKNENKDCHICNFVWDQVKAAKGDKELVKSWAKYLPKLNVLVAGKIRGREDEGPKFFRISSNEKGRSENHAALYDWFNDPDTQNWLDSDEGIDMLLTYTVPDAAKAAFLNGAKFVLSKVELARKSTAFGDDYDKFSSEVKDVDAEVYTKKTTEETLAVLTDWRKKMAAKKDKSQRFNRTEELNSTDTETTLSFDSDEPSPAPSNTEQTTADVLSKKLEALEGT